MKKFHVRILLIAIALSTGCQNGGGGGETADQLVKDGWGAYASKSYRSAASKFNQAISMDGNLTDAYNGAGWSYAQLSILDTSVLKFTTGRMHDSANTEINAGLGIVENALKAYASSIQFAGSALQKNPAWTFSRDNTVNWSDLQVLLAEDFYALSLYDSSLVHVKTLNASFTADVSTFAGQKLLSQEIELLRSLYGS